MLNQLDTLIGFAVVMATVSLLITIVTQMVSALLGLRGKYLANALEAMIHKLDPTITAKYDEASKQFLNIDLGKELSKWILTHPVLSDSLLSMAPNKWDRRWVIGSLRKRWSVASAVRPDELFQVLKDVAGVSPGEAVRKVKDRQDLAELADKALKDPANWREKWGEVITKAKSLYDQKETQGAEIVKKAENALKDPAKETQGAERKAEDALKDPAKETQGAEKKAEDATDEKAKRFALEAAMRAAATKVLAALYVPPSTDPAQTVTAAPVTTSEVIKAMTEKIKTDPTFLQLEKWFNTAQDRAQQWFTTRARVVTVMASVIAAFVLQLDALALMQRISSNPDVRAKLVAQADNLQKEGEKVFQNSDALSQPEHKAIIDELGKKYKKEIGTSLDDRPKATAMSEVETWMRETLKGKPNAEAIIADYKQEARKQQVGSKGDAVERINKEFTEKTGVELLPNPYPPFLAEDWTPCQFWRLSWKWSWPPRHLFGILVSAALLSLGAPFWFNSLKTLTNLRPKLAGEIEKEPTQLDEKKK